MKDFIFAILFLVFVSISVGLSGVRGLVVYVPDLWMVLLVLAFSFDSILNDFAYILFATVMYGLYTGKKLYLFIGVFLLPYLVIFAVNRFVVIKDGIVKKHITVALYISLYYFGIGFFADYARLDIYQIIVKIVGGLVFVRLIDLVTEKIDVFLTLLKKKY